MASQFHAILVRFAQLFSVPILNAARPTGDYGTDGQKKALRGDLARDCWLKDNVGVVNVDKVSNTWDIDAETVSMFAAQGIKVDSKLKLSQMADLEMERREAAWASLKSEAQTGGTKEKLRLTVWEKLYVEAGKIIKPLYIFLTGNRRASEFFNAMVERVDLTNEETGKPFGLASIDDTVPVIYEDYSGKEYRLKIQVRENAFKKRDFLPESAIDQLIITSRKMNYGASQSAIRDTFTSPTLGVKYYYLILLDRKFPEVGIYERCQLKPDNDRCIPLAAVRHDVLQGMGQRFTAESTKEYNAKPSTKQEMPVLTQKEVEEYFSTGIKKGAGGGGVKIMDKTNIQNLSLQNANPIVRAAAEAIHANETKGLEPMIAIAPACNYLLVLKRDDDYPNAERLLKALAETPKGKQRNDLEAKLLKVIS